MQLPEWPSTPDECRAAEEADRAGREAAMEIVAEFRSHMKPKIIRLPSAPGPDRVLEVIREALREAAREQQRK